MLHPRIFLGNIFVPGLFRDEKGLEVGLKRYMIEVFSLYNRL